MRKKESQNIFKYFYPHKMRTNINVTVCICIYKLSETRYLFKYGFYNKKNIFFFSVSR